MFAFRRRECQGPRGPRPGPGAQEHCASVQPRTQMEARPAGVRHADSWVP